MDERGNGAGGQYVRIYTPSYCSRCQNHDIVVMLKGHKMYCQYSHCNCERCQLTAERQKVLGARKTAIRRAEEQDRRGNAIVDNPRSFGQTFASFKAAMLDDTDFLQQALDAGMDINKPLYPYGPTALHVAVTDGRRRIAEYLLNKGANINGKDVCGFTPLMKAVSTNQTECIELLLEKGACVNEQSYIKQKSCLHIACGMGNIDLSRILIRDGANINAINFDGSTPLHCVVESSSTSLVKVELCKLLIGGGAGLNAKNLYGHTPLMEAVSTNQIECTELLLEKGACADERTNVRRASCLHIACESGNIELARVLIRHGANINARFVHRSTPLHCVVQNRPTTLVMIELCKLLIGEGADVNAQDALGCTPLHKAVMGSKYANMDFSSVEWLIGNGARVDIKNKNNQTPFDVAQMNPKIKENMVKHITKMRVAGLRVGVSSEVVDQDMGIKYLEEMEQIKLTKINEKHTLDVLFSNTESPMYLTSSKAFMENIITTPTLEEIFPHYASLLRIQYELASKRFQLLNLANCSLSDLRNMTYLHKLPYVFMQKTLEYLNNEELKSLIKSLNISQALDD